LFKICSGECPLLGMYSPFWKRPVSKLLTGTVSGGQVDWGPEYDSEDLVKWHVGHLRRKIELNPEKPELVITRRGFGYVYARPAA